MTEQTTVRVFINGRGVDVPSGSTTLEAVRIADSAAAEGVESGTRELTDSRGITASPADTIYAGAIYRIVGSRARPAEAN